jgi:protein transport protein SEC24
VEKGRRWRCNFCSLVNQTPNAYYPHLDATGLRADRFERPELSNGAVDIVAPAEYMVRPPQPPVFVFVVDISHEAVASGMLACAIDAIKSSIDHMAASARAQIAFITFDAAIHFYSLKATAGQPQMLVVPDLTDLFLPVPDDLLVNLNESRHIVDELLDSLPRLHAKSSSPDSALGSAFQSASSIMHSIGGKMMLFASRLPNLGNGKLPLRGNPRLLGTDKEHGFLSPNGAWYKNQAVTSSRHQERCVGVCDAGARLPRREDHKLLRQPQHPGQRPAGSAQLRRRCRVWGRVCL